MFDAIVIGARCGGAPTAMLLARKGHKVLLVDRSSFPSEIPQGHFIHRGGPRLLKKWGLLERVVASGCPVVDKATSNYGDYDMTATDLVVDGVAWGYGPRRGVLDKLLVDAAVEAGVEFRPQFTVEGFELERGAITGIRGRDRRSGRMAVETARITIGADGKNSLLARTVGASVYFNFPALTCTYFSYWSGVPHRGLEMHIRKGNALFSFPTHDGLFAIFSAWPIGRFPEIRKDLDGQFGQAIDAVPGFGEMVRAGRREERIYGTADLPNFFRKPYGRGWALVGDAGYHKDPFLALGVADAFRDAELLAEAVHAGVSGEVEMQRALSIYERKRNSAAAEDYSENLRAARLGGMPAEFLQLRAALRGNQEQINRFFKARMGMIPKNEFFGEENMAQLMNHAPAQLEHFRFDTPAYPL